MGLSNGQPSLTALAQRFVQTYRTPSSETAMPATKPATPAAPAVDTYAESRAFTDRSNCRRAMAVFAGTHLLSPEEFDVLKKGEREFRFQRRKAASVAPEAPKKPTHRYEDGIPADLKIPADVRKASWDNRPTKAIPAATAKEPDMARKTATTTKASARAPVAEGSRSRYDWAKAEELAAKGKVPPALDFSAPTHARFRDALAEVVKAAKAGDAKALAAVKINPVSSSPKALDRYRKLCVKAVKASAAA